MRNYKILMYLSILVFFACSNVSKNDSIVDKRLSDLLKSKNFYKLRLELDNVQNKLSEVRLLYYKTYCAQAFDNGQQSNEYADVLLSNYKNQLNDTIVSELLAIKSNNYIRSYHYKEAGDIYKTILEKYKSLLDSSEIADYQNAQQLFGTLALVRPQIIHKQNDIKISSYRNRFNHLMTPVKCGGIADEFIFDTGANLSAISVSYAKKMGLTFYESDITVGTVTHITVQTKLAVADSLYVGDILFENVVFLVTPDEQMSFPAINYEVHGIIGFPVIHQMGEIRMKKDGTVIVPKEVQDRKLHNMCLEGLNPIVQLISDSDTLLFTLDTGAKYTELSKRYYDNNKDEVEKNGKLQTSQRGGGGGVVEEKIYRLQNFPYTIGTKSNVLSEIPVILSEYTFNKYFDGNLGQDIFLQFNEMILNFQYMYIDFE